MPTMGRDVQRDYRAMRALSCRPIEPLDSVEAYTRALDGLSGATSKTEVQNASRIIHGRERKRSPSAALSLYPEGPKVPYRISSLGPCEPAVFPQEAPILELLRWSAAISDSLRVVQAGAVVVALDFLPFGDESAHPFAFRGGFSALPPLLRYRGLRSRG